MVIRLLASLLAVVALSGCASAPPWPDSVESVKNGARLVSDTPFFPQERYQCGPAALATMLASQGIDVTPDELVPQVYLPEREGSLKVELVSAARRYGLLVYPLQAQDLTDIIAEVDVGHPVLVMQNLGFEWFPQWHFAVVVGYDSQADELILHTDTRRANRQPRTVFYRTWSRAGHWSAVMLRPNEFPATASPLPFLEAANDLEVTGQLSEAFQAYQAAAAQWPEQSAAWLGAGNAAYAMERWHEAASYYQQTVQRFPRLGPGWNNFAHALAQNGCATAANNALMCANALDSDRYPRDLSVSAGSGAVCPTIDCPLPLAQ